MQSHSQEGSDGILQDETLRLFIVILSLSRVSLVSLGFCAPASSELEHVPVEHVVVGESLPVEQITEQLT